MKTIQVIILALTLAVPSWAKVNIVATLPDFGAIAEAVGGDHVKVTTIARGTEDPHFVNARPSFIRVLNQADLLIEGGAELEVGWLPPLVRSARNSKILPNGSGRLNLTRHVEIIDKPAGPVDRSMGDVHASGNPHFWLDPVNGKKIAEAIAGELARIDSEHAAHYKANAANFSARIDEKLPGWIDKLKPFRGTKVMTYHKSYDYFARRFELEITGQFEPKPGIEPSAVHISRLVSKAKDDGVQLVIIEPYRPRRNVEPAADAIGAKLLVLPEKVGGTEEARDYISLFDHNVNVIARTLKE